MDERVLDWEGCNNVRDLGGLRTVDGRVTCRGAVLRGDTPGRLSAVGWAALHAYGVRTIITLRTDGMVEPELDYVCPYADISRLSIDIEDITDPDFYRLSVETSLWGTPLYFADALRRWPEKHAAVLSAIARAQHGGVLFHCIRGYDRTGIISFLTLALVGVELGEIAADYELSVDPVRDRILAERQTSVVAALQDALEGLDVRKYLISGGASEEDLAAVRRKLLG